MSMILNVSEARKNLYSLIDDIYKSHKPVFIKGKRHSAVLIAEEDWASLQETLYLISIPGMAKSIKEGLAEPVEKCDEKLDW
jgi:antitoxin YefM